MTEDDLKVAFRRLDPVEPSASFASAVRSIPHRYPRPEKMELSFWQLFRLPSRLATLATAAFCGLGVGYLTLEQTPEPADADLSAFLELDTNDSLFADSDNVDWDSQ
jgi:hypothetical protein